MIYLVNGKEVIGDSIQNAIEEYIVRYERENNESNINIGCVYINNLIITKDYEEANFRGSNMTDHEIEIWEYITDDDEVEGISATVEYNGNEYEIEELYSEEIY